MKKFVAIVLILIVGHSALVVVQCQTAQKKISSKLDFEGSQENLNLSTKSQKDDGGGGGGDDDGEGDAGDNQRPHYGMKNKKYDDSNDDDGPPSTPIIAGGGGSSSDENRDERRRNRKGPTIHGVRVTVDTGGGGGGGGGGGDSFTDGANQRSSKEYKESVEIIDSGGGKHKARIGIHTGITFEIIGDTGDEKNRKDHSNPDVNGQQNGNRNRNRNRNDDSGSSSVLILKGRGGDSSSSSHHHQRRPYNPKSSEWDPNLQSSSAAAAAAADDGDGFGRYPSSRGGYYPHYIPFEDGRRNSNTNTNTGYWSNFAAPPAPHHRVPASSVLSTAWTTETTPPHHSARSILPYAAAAADYQNPIWKECYCFSSSSSSSSPSGSVSAYGGYRDRRDATILFLTDHLAKNSNNNANERFARR